MSLVLHSNNNKNQTNKQKENKHIWVSGLEKWLSGSHAENSGSVLSTNIRWLTTAVTPVPEELAPPSGLQRHLATGDAHTDKHSHANTQN